jgi:hypothetical protein
MEIGFPGGPPGPRRTGMRPAPFLWREGVGTDGRSRTWGNRAESASSPVGMLSAPRLSNGKNSAFILELANRPAHPSPGLSA